MKKSISFLLLVLIAVSVLIGTFVILPRFRESKSNAETTELVYKYTYEESSIEPSQITTLSDDVPTADTSMSALLRKEDLIDLNGLRKENPDVWCVLRIPDTVIDYPVMIDATGMDRYFDHDFFGNESRCGCIYTDKGTTFDQNNVLLYGHHMRNGEMFGSLSKYADKDYLGAHKELKLIGDGMLHQFEIIGYFTISPEDTGIEQYLGLNFDTDYEGLEKVAKEHGYLTKALDPERKYASLITCEYTRANERAVVIAENTENISFGRN